jgi:hypothetical protein
MLRTKQYKHEGRPAGRSAGTYRKAKGSEAAGKQAERTREMHDERECRAREKD